MRVVKHLVDVESRKENEWYLVALGDMHLGNSNVDFDLLERVLAFIKETDRCLWLGMGDYGEAISVKDRRFDLQSIDKEYATPDKQYRQIEQMFLPIRKKCIGLLDGNHDYQHWLDHNHNYVDNMAYNLSVPYLTMDAYVRLVFKRLNEKDAVNIYAHHGWSNARTSGGRVNRIEDLATIFPNLDLYLMGHVHMLGTSPSKHQLSVDQNLNIIEHKEMFVFTGSFLKGYVDGNVSYVERKTYSPTALGSPKITIKMPSGHKGDRVKISVEELS